MKYIITEEQYNKIIKEVQNTLHIPSVELFGDWDGLKKYLKKKGNPPYSIGGNLDLRDYNVKSLGNLISVGGDLNLGAISIQSLGDLTSVGGDLILPFSPRLKSLGGLTSVGGDLFINYSKVESLGDLTSVGGNLIMYNTPLSKIYSEEQIRQMIKIGGRVNLWNTL